MRLSPFPQRRTNAHPLEKTKDRDTPHCPSDPLHQMPQSVEVQTFGISEDYGTIRFDGSNAFGSLPVSSRNDRPKSGFAWCGWAWKTFVENLGCHCQVLFTVRAVQRAL